MYKQQHQLSLIMALIAALTAPMLSLAGPSVANRPSLTTAHAQQTDCQTFIETGKTVCGRFLDYWQQRGGLPQQGYPISEEMQARSDTDGKTYTVQYFERAVFERHPENAAPYDVLLSLLGVTRYREKYPLRSSGVTSQAQPGTCTATYDDSDIDSGAGFIPEAPERQTVGKGLVLTGRVLSSRDCAPIAGVKLEMRPEVNNGHPDAQRATLYTDANGRYRFESDFPEHIHMRVSAHGFKTIITNAYHTTPGKSADSYDVALTPDPSCTQFDQTGHALCGTFLSYWRAHGGLAQQGYPISDEFMEKSDLNGKTYRVQYFERAVFERHLENQPPYDVLLSQLGTVSYRAKYAQAPAGRVELEGNMVVARTCRTSTLLPNGKALIAGGCAANTASTPQSPKSGYTARRR